jgi:hypothetical protein
MVHARWMAPALVAVLPVLAGCADGGAPSPASSQEAPPMQPGVRRATPVSFALAHRAPRLASASPLRSRSFDRGAPDAVRSPLLAFLAPASVPPVALSLGDFFHPPAPQLLSGGPTNVMPTPTVVPVYFGNQPYRDQMQAFFEKLGSSAYWAAATAEYGVGPIAVSPAITIPATLPPLDGVGAYEWLTQTIASFPTPSPNAIYSFVIPPIDESSPSAHGLCTSYGGYHSAVTLPSGQNVPLTFIGTCSNYLGLSGLDGITHGLSHELVETVTDPLTAGLGYLSPNWQGSGWASAAEGSPSAEVGDMCEFQLDATYADPGLGFTVQRMWSNKAAAAWHDPCVPAPTRTYFNAQPIVGGVHLAQGTFSTGVNVPPGGEVTIPVRLFADGPMPEWSLSAVELVNPHLTPDTHHLLSFLWDRAAGFAGEVRFLTIKRAVLPPGVPPPFLGFSIVSTSGSTQNVWWVVVGS